MTWKPIDFQGIITLDKPLVDQLKNYLEEKESHLGLAVIKAIPSPPDEPAAPLLAPSSQPSIKLSESVEILGRKVRQIARNPKKLAEKEDCRKAIKVVNVALWDYVEALEGCVTELFQQIDQVGFSHWHKELTHIVDAIKEVLAHHIEDLAWAVRRIDGHLKEYQRVCLRKNKGALLFVSIFKRWKMILDRALLPNLEKSRKFLGFRYKVFIDRCAAYGDLKEKIDRSVEKFSSYQVLAQLDTETQDKFTKIYSLLKLWELNHAARSIPEREPIRALRNYVGIDRATGIFKEYYAAMRASLFERSRAYKENPNDFFLNPQGKMEGEAAINGFRAELHTLGATLAKYREFLLRTDPNPYVRTRWGFAEWIVGPEPVQTKNLLKLGYEVEDLDTYFVCLGKALDKGPSSQEGFKIGHLNQEIQGVLHEMGQPLTSRNLMRVRAERLLSMLQEIDELGSFNPHATEYVGMTLSKALRADWKYHVLHEIPEFHKIYMIHQGIVGPIQDRHHMNRIHRFKKLTHQIEQWVKNNDTTRHAHEIEMDMNDMKNYLQDFLAFVQRTASDAVMDLGRANQVINDIAQELLEYRYLFGNFFNHLRQNEPEEKMIRNQFLFVDQYFESIENKLHDLRQTKWQPKT